MLDFIALVSFLPLAVSMARCVGVGFCVGFLVRLPPIESDFFGGRMIMAKRAYQGGMPKPDRRGYYRPEVGGVRFIVGHKNEISEGGSQASSGGRPRPVQQTGDLFTFVPGL